MCTRIPPPMQITLTEAIALEVSVLRMANQFSGEMIVGLMRTFDSLIRRKYMVSSVAPEASTSHSDQMTSAAQKLAVEASNCKPEPS
jgi:hypothetical protein